ncbi:MAG: thioredoxin domain-containing protein [Anditalea sp.]
MSPKANKLINSQSPYLLQHAHNPVNWHPWGKDALARAKEEKRPILVSIGYSACHWCHVMEHESFEDEETARLMNEHFVCIKIDREERPDLDNIYMDAIQVMGLQGGWPLNVFLMPDQKPFYGGTYFPNKNWKSLLLNIAEAFEKHHDQLAESAESFGRSISAKETAKYDLKDNREKLSAEVLALAVQNLTKNFDPEWGGMKRSPKFPMPAIWSFLLDFSLLQKEESLQEKVLFTLKKMGMGGIYDHIGGGFARYSVDEKWFAPHFEKMLYDNGQLLRLYSKAYQITGDDFFEEKIVETVHWLEKEMLQEEGGFYAALDADSEGVEGKFYTWTKSELDEVLGDDAEWFAELYNVKTGGNWEEGGNILFQTKSYEEICQKFNLKTDTFKDQLNALKDKLFKIRAARIRPGLDDKIISGWNGLAISGLTQAYLAIDDSRILEMAINNGEFLISKMIKETLLYRSYKNGKAYTPAFLEDYAAVIQAFIHLYQLTFDQKWLVEAKNLTDYTLIHFFDKEDGFFYFNNPDAEKLIANKKELFDNVIPASNSTMARNLHQLGIYFYEDQYEELSRNMLGPIKRLLVTDVGFLANWANLYLDLLVPTAEVAVIGKHATEKALAVNKSYHPNTIIAATETATENLPLLQGKTADSVGNALIYVCFKKVCQKPVLTIEEAFMQFPTLA